MYNTNQRFHNSSAVKAFGKIDCAL